MQSLIACLPLWAVLNAAQTATPEWPQRRGPFNTGMASGSAPPTWEDSTNIRTEPYNWAAPYGDIYLRSRTHLFRIGE